MPPTASSVSTGLTITNPLVLYRALVATKQIDPDPAQHRLAIHLQKLYHRLKDYSPQTEYGSRLKAISQVVGKDHREEFGDTIAVKSHPLRNNPLLSSIFAPKQRRDSRALTRVLTSHEAAMNLNSPKGLLLYGEVGTGKSLLVDLLADSLPNCMKKRWHFNTFMLETISKLEGLRQQRVLTGNEDSEYSLLWLAKDMVEKSPILFLDEFQLPDRASSKILSNLLTTFFQLGGVLIASSNRMPDELDKAAGVEYAPPPRAGLVRNIFGFKPGREGRGTAVTGNSEFAGFLEVLKARCEVWDMEGQKDWRRRESEAEKVGEDIENPTGEIVEGFTDLDKIDPGNIKLGYEKSIPPAISTPASPEIGPNRPPSMGVIAPRKYLVSTIDNEEAWSIAVNSTLPKGTPNPIPWSSMTLLVYGRTVVVPREISGVALWTFDELCGGAFGPADYITMASTFHTLVLDDVPVLTILQKNEARRLITLLDALYEARCKLIFRAEAGPDELFFPEASKSTTSMEGPYDENEGGDAVYPETLSEIYQDQTSPFRPNVSLYTGEDVTKISYDPREDSDFGPLPGKGKETNKGVNFGMTSSFTGEDERFAYKRARSRLWEMCGARWHARTGTDWWKPLPLEVRRWEQSAATQPQHSITGVLLGGDVMMGDAVELDRPAGMQGKELEAKKAGILEGKENPWVREKEAESYTPSWAWSNVMGMVGWANSDAEKNDENRKNMGRDQADKPKKG
jgi:protein AFG1